MCLTHGVSDPAEEFALGSKQSIKIVILGRRMLDKNDDHTQMLQIHMLRVSRICHTSSAEDEKKRNFALGKHLDNLFVEKTIKVGQLIVGV